MLRRGSQRRGGEWKVNLDSLPPILRTPVERWWERACALSDFSANYASLSDALRAELPRVVAMSEFVAAALIQDGEALAWFERCEQGGPQAWQAANLEYEQRAASAADAAAAMRTLREWRRREMLRIAWRDIAGRAALTHTLEAVSSLADACIRAAWQAARRGASKGDEHVPSEPLIVIGMGKLGGRELNFSSDIDLVLLCPNCGSDEYFERLGREFIRLLDARTADGFVFRVDMRLRPFGESGPLVVTLSSLENYLLEHGRDWERYAWIKARAIIGAEAYAPAYEQWVRPFVYRRYLDFGVFESLRAMKALIAREVARRDLDQHLKLGSGGIREIEFIVQSLQLVRGGSDRRLQNASILEVLPRLAGSRLISAASIAQLEDAYLVLRKAENGVQMMRDEQTHLMPDDAGDRARLALAMNLPGWPEALQRIDTARRNVARQFEDLLFGAPQSARRQDVGVAWLDSDNVKIDAELKARGLRAEQIAPVAAALQDFKDAASYRRLDESGHRRLYVIIDRLLAAVGNNPHAATIVERVLRVLEAIGARSSYLALLKEQPPALQRLIEVCAISGFLSRQIAAFPLLLDELLDAKAFDELPSRQGFVAQLEARTDRMPANDPERQVEALRQFQKTAVFNVALADLTDRLPLMRVSDRLTDIAELIIQCCMDLAWQQMTQAHGVPYCGESESNLRPVVIAVAGYGKLGGLELGYGSDLDLVFLHDSSGQIQATRAERSIDNTLFFLRLGQRIVHLLTMHSAAGRLYEVDMRLRPNGKGGFLMTGIDAFERYQREEAWTWEHQALLRARAVAGDMKLRAAFEAVRRRVLSGAVERETLRNDVAEMRLRMRRELSKGDTSQFDMKQGAGGIADIEFLVQYWVLAAAPAHPQILDFTDNVRQLEGLAALGVLEPATAQWLTEAYVSYRTVLHHLSLEGDGERVVDAAPYVATRERVRQIWRETFG